MCEHLYEQCCQKIRKNVLQTKQKVYINKHGLFSFMNLNTRETREGWPLLTSETEANGDSKSTNKKGPSLVGSLGSRVPVQEIFILPWLL
jgi:predicted peptidase